MKLEDVKCKKLIKYVEVDGYDNRIIADTKFVKAKWDGMTDEKRQGWHTSMEERYKVDADDIFDNIFERLHDWEMLDEHNEGYVEHIATELRTEKNKEKLQKVLDEIFDNELLSVYFPDEEIEND